MGEAAIPPRIFDRDTWRQRHARAARMGSTEILVDEATETLIERIGSTGRRFSRVLLVGTAHDSPLRSAVPAEAAVHAGTFLARDDQVVVDEEFLPFASSSFDLVVSLLSLHAVNDLPGALIQIRRALTRDGLFVAALFGGATLFELRQAFAAGENETVGGVSPRVAPFADVRDLGGLLQRAGFDMPVADVERTIVRYREFTTLVKDLRALGETNVLTGRSRKPLRRATLAAALSHYVNEHADTDGRLRATFDTIYLTGWVKAG